MKMYRALLACALTACSVPDYFLVDGQGSGSGSAQTDAGADAVPDAAPGAALVTNVTATNPDGFYKAGDAVTIKVTFDSSVTVDESGGTPTMALTTGGRGTYVSGTGTNTLTFTYTVVAGEQSSDLDYTGTTALALNGGTIKNGTVSSSVTLPAPGATGSLGANKALAIDAVAPLVGTITGPNLYSPSNGATLTYAVIETNAGTTTCTQTAGTGVVASCSTTGAMVTSLSEGAHTISITHTDAAGNVSTAKTYSWTVDTITPVVSNVAGPAAYVQGTNANLTFSVTEANQGTTTCTQTAGTGTATSCTATGATFTNLSEGAHTVSITHTDLASHTSTAKTISWTVDTINPSISAITGPAAFDNHSSLAVSFTLTEANQGTTSCTFTTGSGVTSGCSATGVNLSNLSEGQHVLLISHTDLAGRTGTQTITWIVDTIAPVISGLTGPNWSASDPVTLTYTVSDTNLGTTTCGQASGTATVSQCTNTRATYSAMSVGTHDFTIKHTDKAGNVANDGWKFVFCPPQIFQTAGAFMYTIPASTAADPACGTQMEVWLWGGGGGGGNPNTSGGTGGGGGFVAGKLTVTPGDTYTISVGGGGKGSTGGINGGGSGGVGTNERGGGGGGLSAVSLVGAAVAIAGGGGGGGGCSAGANGGGAGGGTGGNGGGQSGMGGFGGDFGFGAGQGGANGGQAGNGNLGGNGAGPGNLCGGGGGGAGAFGGGGGGSLGPPPTFGTGGGGGGNSFADAAVTNVQVLPATGSVPGGKNAPQYQQGVGVGAASGAGLNGGDGMVIVHVHP